MNKHTAGPWKIEQPAHQQSKRVVDCTNGDSIAGIIRHEPDAALIAAAPDLLAALETMLEYDTGTPDDVLKQARAALAKAKGQQ